MVDVISAAGETVDTLGLEAKQLDGLEALVNKQRDCGPIPSIKVVQSHTKDRLDRGQVGQESSPVYRRGTLHQWSSGAVLLLQFDHFCGLSCVWGRFLRRQIGDRIGRLRWRW